MWVASVDVGIVNLAIVFAELEDHTHRLIRIARCENVDTRNMVHDVVGPEECKLGHTKTSTDRLQHFVQERRTWFDRCDRVLIERQPIMGHTDVEQLLYLTFRNKAELVSPNSMHKFFNISGYTYEGRKIMTVQIADQLLPPDRFPEYHALERQHDVADALCLLLFWIQKEGEKAEKERLVAEEKARQAEVAKSTVDFAAMLDKYRYREFTTIEK
jgi:hypothetical protein